MNEGEVVMMMMMVAKYKCNKWWPAAVMRVEGRMEGGPGSGSQART
jgi:hypothetical protein